VRYALTCRSRSALPVTVKLELIADDGKRRRRGIQLINTKTART
jgi:hypothetical protein